MTPTARTLAMVRAEGFEACIVEKWNVFARILFSDSVLSVLRRWLHSVCEVLCVTWIITIAALMSVYAGPSVWGWCSWKRLEVEK